MKREGAREEGGKESSHGPPRHVATARQPHSAGHFLHIVSNLLLSHSFPTSLHRSGNLGYYQSHRFTCEGVGGAASAIFGQVLTLADTIRIIQVVVLCRQHHLRRDSIHVLRKVLQIPQLHEQYIPWQAYYASGSYSCRYALRLLHLLRHRPPLLR